MFKNRHIVRRLRQLGSSIDTSYLVYINNEEPISFPTKEAAFSYIRSYRDETAISRLQIYRIETYSL